MSTIFIDIFLFVFPQLYISLQKSHFFISDFFLFSLSRFYFSAVTNNLPHYNKSHFKIHCYRLYGLAIQVCSLGDTPPSLVNSLTPVLFCKAINYTILINKSPKINSRKKMRYTLFVYLILIIIMTFTLYYFYIIISNFIN